jgi:hypothetical protein
VVTKRAQMRRDHLQRPWLWLWRRMRLGLRARKVLGWPEICKLAHAFLWEYGYKRLKLAQFLGKLCVFLTCDSDSGAGAATTGTSTGAAVAELSAVDDNSGAPPFWLRCPTVGDAIWSWSPWAARKLEAKPGRRTTSRTRVGVNGTTSAENAFHSDQERKWWSRRDRATSH